MFAKKTLNDNEFAFISGEINRTKKFLLAMFVIIAAIIAIVAIIVYTQEDKNHVIINIIFGILILLLCFINWFVKGYKEHVIETTIHTATGFYQRIYEQHGKYGRYYDTIHGVKVKIPWHWRQYLKSHKEEAVSYEYILRDGVVAANQGASRYVLSINDTLSLDYEIKNGLKKARSLSFINIISILLIIPVFIIFFANPDIKRLKDISDITKTKADLVILEDAEALGDLKSSSYIQINNAWIYQFKRSYDFNGENYVLSKTERDRIYNNPSSHFNYEFYLPERVFTKPDKESFKAQLKKNMSQLGFNKKIDSSIWQKSIDMAYELQIETFNKRLYKAKRLDSIFKVLQPKTPLLKLYDSCFNAPEESTYTIKSSLENTFVVSGFYNPNNNSIRSFEDQEKIKKDLKNVMVLAGICSLIVLSFLMALFKIIRNSMLKINLVEGQLNTHSGPERLGN